MINIDTIERLADKFDVPLEDALFISMNTQGVSFECDYNRMRMAFRLDDSKLFAYAKGRNEMEYYFALPVIKDSPFVLNKDNRVMLENTVIGQAVGVTEDICDSNYPRRKGTSLNINPNTRTGCHGCAPCYTGYQVPHDRKRLEGEADLEEFFEEWMAKYGFTSLSHLIQVSVVTGCYKCNKAVSSFLLLLRQVLKKYAFTGRIFYLGSQVITRDQLEILVEAQPLGICYSLETFERREELLRKDKASLTLQDACDSMDNAMELGFEVNFTCIVGLESLKTMEYHFRHFSQHINKFPTINTLQLHKMHASDIIHSSARRLMYFLEARKMLEEIFLSTNLRPLVWEDYRSLWFLKFGNESLLGIRTP